MASRPKLRAVPDLSPPTAMDAEGAAALAIEPLPCPGVTALGEEVADLREGLFALGDLARRALPRGAEDVHVAMQVAAHQLGEVERLLRAL